MRQGPVEGFWWIARFVWFLEKICKPLLALLCILLARAKPIRLQGRDGNGRPWIRLPLEILELSEWLLDQYLL